MEIASIGDNTWPQVKNLLEQLYKIVDDLEKLFPERRFTPDGHLVGSIGEVIAAYMYGLVLEPHSTPGHDAKAIQDGRRVQIKFTQGNSGYEISEQPDHLIALRLVNRTKVVEVFNGPGHIAWKTTGNPTKRGEFFMSITRLQAEAATVSDSDKLPCLRPIKL